MHSGSSAGGHLVGMLLAGGWQADYGVPEAVMRGSLPISGLFDLRPLLPPISTVG
jgi:arylformamidase